MPRKDDCIWTKEHLDDLLRVRSAESAERRKMMKMMKEWDDISDEVHERLDALIIAANASRNSEKA